MRPPEFSLISCLKTSRIRIVPFSQSHLTDRYVGWLNDPDVVRYTEQRHFKHTQDTCRQFANSLSAAGDSFFAVETHTHGHVGNLVVRYDRPNDAANLAILIGDRAAWGGGYGTEAWTAMLANLLQQEGLRKVFAGTMSENTRMLAVMRKSGMVIEGRQPGLFVLDGREVDMVFAGAHRETWTGAAV